METTRKEILPLAQNGSYESLLASCRKVDSNGDWDETISLRELRAAFYNLFTRDLPEDEELAEVEECPLCDGDVDVEKYSDGRADRLRVVCCECGMGIYDGFQKGE